MTDMSAAMRAHHHKLAERLGTQVAALSESQPEADVDALVTFLKRELLPHAQGEERHLYPALDPIIKAHGTPTATMSVDHEFIGGYVRQIEEIAQTLRAADEADRPALRARLRRLALQLDGLFEVHLAKEERIYLPLVERYLSQDERQRILEGMHEAPVEETMTAAGQDAVETLDVREVPPARRHPMIFGVFEQLKPGTAFILVNDHDPKPLYYQLNFEHAGALIWEYLEEGPETWRVRVGKVA